MRNGCCNSVLKRLALALACVLSMELHATTSSEQPEVIKAQRENIAYLTTHSDEIIGLEAIVADGTDDAFYSRFGHAMLRFVKADGDFATDIAVSLMADVDMQNLDTMKATFGGYPIVPVLNPMSRFWEEYVQTENRPLSRYVLVSTPTTRKKLIKTLKAWIENPKLAGTYTFIHNNCVGALAKLLETSGFPKTQAINPRIPTHFDQWLKQSLDSPFPVLRVTSPRAVLTKASSLLGIGLSDLNNGQKWPSDAASILNAQLSDLEIKQLLLELSGMPYPVRSELVQNHHFGNGTATLEDVMSFRPVPAEMYQLCQDESCMDRALASVSKLWSQDEWQDALRQDEFSFWLATGRRESDDIASPLPPASLPKFPETLKYYQLLLNE